MIFTFIGFKVTVERSDQRIFRDEDYQRYELLTPYEQHNCRKSHANVKNYLYIPMYLVTRVNNTKNTGTL